MGEGDPKRSGQIIEEKVEFNDFDLAAVDNVDTTAGKVAMVFALLGAEGDFGVKSTADSLLLEVFTNEGIGTMVVPDIQVLLPAERE